MRALIVAIYDACNWHGRLRGRYVYIPIDTAASLAYSTVSMDTWNNTSYSSRKR